MPDPSKTIGAVLSQALGLPPNVIWFEVRCEAGKDTLIKCECYKTPFELDDDDKLITEIKAYKLAEQGDKSCG